MKIVYNVQDTKGNYYCIVEPEEFQQLENSGIDEFYGFYGYIFNATFIPSTKRKHLDPKILFIIGDENKLNLRV